MTDLTEFDIAFLGHYTHDTIVYTDETLTVAGGAFNYGANVAARMGRRVAVVTRLAEEHWQVVAQLEGLGVAVFARATPQSTCLRLVYPSANLDERRIELMSSAGPFTIQELEGIQAQIWHVGASIRGEVPARVVEHLAAGGRAVSLDVQGYIRTLRDGKLTYDSWHGMASVLCHVTVLKTDAVEATLLTRQTDHYAAAETLAGFGPQEVLLTHNDGCLLYHSGAFYEAPFVPEKIRGRSGRGDTCTAAYLSRRCTDSPAQALAWAAAVTSLKLEAEGPFQQELGEVEALYRQLRRGWSSM
jgi:sugar/nucleoside kinase (ribokinase family)